MARSLSALRSILHVYAWQIVTRVQSPPDEAITVEVDQDNLAVRVEVAPVNPAEKSNPAMRYPGAWLSPVERLVWNALADKPLIGKQIAAKIGEEYDSTLKVLLRNLVNRGVITHDETGGYARGVCVGLK